MYGPKTKQPYDARLKACARELKNVLDRHDVGAAISLASDTHGELLIHFPKWSLIGIDPNNRLHVRIRAKEQARTDASLHVFLSLCEGVRAHGDTLRGVREYVLERMAAHGTQIEHTPIGEQGKEVVQDDWHSGVQPDEPDE